MKKEAQSNIEAKAAKTMQKLVGQSMEREYNPYKDFNWSESLPNDQVWMSPELLSIYKVIPFDTIDDTQFMALCKWESLNFYSINVHGIRELLTAVLQYIYQPGFEEYSDYLNHFLGEENEHMWFFAQFCLRYGGEIMPYKRFRFDSSYPAEIQRFITFSQILIFEEIGHYYNKYMMKDSRLPEIVQSINRVHYEDESRHISMGKVLTEVFYNELLQKHSKKDMKKIEAYLVRYIQFSLEGFYNPTCYRNAGFKEPLKLRNRLLEHPERKAFHRTVLKHTLHFFEDRLGFTATINI
ncbi:diiron oxygenase [Aureisphaera galaxeae]|uniref:diiron oxygenase n=1 Tax=Aureisphaera galaxeae TaxID=1538023 RepID=UPI002350695F|nr:diiron oxygenase [Aureisphaera galaxeae]MDC8004287.1 diiron oxygenase [Aureisphaera galaxeae]